MFSRTMTRALGVTSGIWTTQHFSMAASARSAKIIVIGHEGTNGDEAFQDLPEQAEIVQYIQTEDQVSSIDTDANVLFASEICNPKLMSQVLGRCKNVEWVHSRWAGINHLLCDELVDSDIPVTNAKGAYSYSLGEFCLLGCLYFEKLSPRMLQQKKDHHWEKFMVGEIAGKTLGVIGYGDIGRECASACKKNGMKIVALRRTDKIDDDIVDVAVPSSDINTLMEMSDYVVVALPLTDMTHHLVNREVLSHAKPGCVIINVGRGPCIKEDDLIDALQDGTLRGAFLDVFEVEPLPKESPLWDLENVFISPHTADITPSYYRAGIDIFVRHMKNFNAELAFDSTCDKKAGY